MCQLGSQKLDETTVKLNAFTKKAAEYKHSQGLGVSIESPKGSTLFLQPEFVRTFGTMSKPKPGWMFYLSEGCQLHVSYPGDDDPGRPIQSAVVWLANVDLSSMEMRCKKSAALAARTHEHIHARGTMRAKGEGTQRGAEFPGKYTGVQGTVYARACREFCWSKKCYRGREQKTELQKLADRSPVANRTASAEVTYYTSGIHKFLIRGNDECVDLDGDQDRASPLLEGRPSALSAGARV